MDEQERFREQFGNELRRRMEERRKQLGIEPKTDEEIEQEILAQITDRRPVRLELFYNPKKNMITLQGNQLGLESLASTIAALANAVPGEYAMLDEFTNLTKTNTRFLIRRTGDTDYLWTENGVEE